MSGEQGLTPYETREILFYKTENGEVRVEILLFQENLWLTQAKMAELFEVQKAAISKHLKNIFESGELSEDSVVSKSALSPQPRNLIRCQGLNAQVFRFLHDAANEGCHFLRVVLA